MTTSRYGSDCDDIRYRNESHVINGAISYSPFEKLTFNANVAWVSSRGHMKDVNFADYDLGDLKYDYNTSKLNWPDPYLYRVSYLNRAPGYSSLFYTQTDVDINAVYEVFRNVAVSLNYSYSDYNDKSPYVYGDLGGQYQSLTAFLTLRF